MRKLNITRYSAVGLLELLFNSAYECNSVYAGGCLIGWDVYQIAAAAEWDGDPSAFVSALLSAGFLEIEGEDYYIHDYFAWCPDYVKKRIQRRFQEPNAALTGQRQISADNGGQRRTTDANVRLGKVREGKVKQGKERLTTTPLPPKGGNGVSSNWNDFALLLPEPMRNGRMMAAWVSWVEYRGKKLKPTTLRLQAKKLTEFGLEGAIGSIEQSIGQAWTGLFPVRVDPRNPLPKPMPKPRRNEGIANEAEDYQYLAALKKWKAENGA